MLEQRTMPDHRSRPGAFWQHLFRTRGQLNRLEQAIQIAEPRICARLDPQQRPPPNAALSDSAEDLDFPLAVRLIQGAHEALAAGRPDSGWAQLHAALEAEVAYYDEAEMEALRISLATEASNGCLDGGHAAAVENLLSHLTPPRCHAGTPCGPDCPPAGHVFALQAQALLREALETRNEFYENLYTAIRVSAHRRILLLGIGAVLLVIAAVLIDNAPETATITGDRGFVAASASVAGMLGATTSAIQRLAANPSSTIPAELDSLTATLTRPFIGAVGSLTALFAYQSGLLQLSSEAPIALLLLASFGVGFTERLLVYNPQQQSNR